MQHFMLSTRKTLKELIKNKVKYREITLIIDKSISSISDEINQAFFL